MPNNFTKNAFAQKRGFADTNIQSKRYPNPDFVVEYDPDPTVVGQRVLTNIIVSRLKAKKNTIFFVTGKSREGKSIFVMKMFELICKARGFDPNFYLPHCLIFGAADYMKTMNKLLPPFEVKDPFRRFNIMWIDEGRYVIDASNWNDLMVRSIGHVNATVGALKPMVMFIVAQSTYDIAKRIRRSFDFYTKVDRPLSGSSNARISRLYENDYDLQNVIFGKARLRGFVKLPSGRYRWICPRNFKVSLPERKLRDLYEKVEYDRKGSYIEAIMADMARKEEIENKGIYERVETVIDQIIKNKEFFKLFKCQRGKRIIQSEIKTLYNFSDYEIKVLPVIFDKKMREAGLVFDREKEIDLFRKRNG